MDEDVQQCLRVVPEKSIVIALQEQDIVSDLCVDLHASCVNVRHICDKCIFSVWIELR